jgi:hypothetical protein
MIVRHWSRNKKYRELYWTQVPIKEYLNSPKAKYWCQQQTGDGKFYVRYTEWWFEHEQDALAFKLKWL